MALNPQLLPYGMPVPFLDEVFVLCRISVKFQIFQGPRMLLNFEAEGAIYLSNIRLVFVAYRPTPQFYAYDLPLLYIHGEQFPANYCAFNRIVSGYVEPVVLESDPWPEFSTRKFKMVLKEGRCSTFVPLFSNVLGACRSRFRHYTATPEPLHQRFNPLMASWTRVDEFIVHAHVDASDPTMVFFQPPDPGSHLRRSHYHINA